MMKKSGSSVKHATNRRAFLTNGMMAAGAATMGAAFVPGTSVAFGREVEQVEADLWIQYAELGGATNQGLSTIDLELCPREFEGKRKLRRELGSMWYWRQRQAKSEKRV
jgi:hypothetical protein